MSNIKLTQEIIVNYLKNYGFIFADSEIYGGLAHAWDYGPIGVLLKNNIKKVWWDEFVTKVPNSIGLDCAIINNPKTYIASGHLKNFSDLLLDCKNCKERFRADKLINDFDNSINVSESTPLEKIDEIITKNHIVCPNCQKFNWTNTRKFNLMFKTFIGVEENTKSTVYLRPETCQPIFMNFLNVSRTTRMKLPFSICQIGKSFRNEITPGNFIFRTREFEQMEIEYFTYPQKSMKEFDE
jgi:glycyl-tRNA synthetase